MYNPLEEQMVLDQIYSAMYKSVEKMLPCDSPMGCLLSGGKGRVYLLSRAQGQRPCGLWNMDRSFDVQGYKIDLAISLLTPHPTGLDSSLVAAFARKILSPEIPLHTFTIGLDNAPDFKFARQVAKHLGSVHHEFTYTVQEGIDVIPQVSL